MRDRKRGTGATGGWERLRKEEVWVTSKAQFGLRFEMLMTYQKKKHHEN